MTTELFTTELFATELFTTELWFALIGALIIGISTIGFFGATHILKRIMAFNLMGSGVFLIMVGLAQHDRGVDPVPQALVLTGIVVAVSATALALIIFRRYIASGGQSKLPEHRS
ncbi:MAG: NADH-quinone oxidoreductase subunit K [Idiomarina sp.]|nr:NADH-quinone oxidoreductase subunit K [Idiomarina sp.]